MRLIKKPIGKSLVAAALCGLPLTALSTPAAITQPVVDYKMLPSPRTTAYNLAQNPEASLRSVMYLPWKRAHTHAQAAYGLPRSRHACYRPQANPNLGKAQMWAASAWQFTKELDLSNEQSRTLQEIAAELSFTHWELSGKRLEIASRLPRLYSAPRPNAEEIGAVYTEIFDIKRQMIEAAIEVRNQATDLLSDEQREKLHQIWNQGLM